MPTTNGYISICTFSFGIIFFFFLDSNDERLKEKEGDNYNDFEH